MKSCRTLGPLRIATFNRSNDLLVLADHALWIGCPLRDEVGVKPHDANVRRLISPQQSGMPRRGDDRLVKPIIKIVGTRKISASYGVGHFLAEISQIANEAFGATHCRQSRRRRLKPLAHRIDFEQVARADRGDVVRRMRNAADEPFAFQTDHSLAQRDAAHAEFNRQLAFNDSLSRVELATVDHGLKAFVNGVDGHRRRSEESVIWLTPDLENGIPFPVLSQTINAVARLDTPCIVVDDGVMQRNLDRLASYGELHGLRIRPHAKTHKSRQIAQRQLDRGAIGLTVAKPSEAQALADVCDDILLAYPVVDESRAKLLASLAARVDLKASIDSVESLEVLAAAGRQAGVNIGVLVDLDVGLHRTGVQSPAAALQLAQLVERHPGIELRGLFCYPGHIWTVADQQETSLAAVARQLGETLELWQRSGLNAEIVSGGSTPTAYQSHLVPQLTEIRPGTYPFNDMNTVRGGYATINDCAARMVVTVVSSAIDGQVVIDAGTKTLAADRCVPAPNSGHGYVVEYPDAIISTLSEEHGQVDVSACSRKPRIGERLTIIPNHICPCINLQERVWLTARENDVVPLLIDARGRVT